MARPPAGPIGNSPRDVRDDAIGAPPDVIKAGEPPRWPPKRKKITSNTFHAKVSGGTSGKRADRPPTFRRGGMVSGYKKGGFVVEPRSEDVVEHRRAKSQVADKIENKREDLPGVQKNDTSSDQNLRGKPVKFEDKPVFEPSDMRRKARLARGGAIPPGARLAGAPGPPSDNKKKNVPQYAKGGPVAKAGRFQFGGMSGRPPGQLRSEMTEAEKGRRTLQRTPPVTIMEDAIGAFSEGKAQSNAVRDAIRRGAADKIKESGYEQENKGFAKGYDFKASGGGVKKRQAGGSTPFSSAPGKDGGPSDMDKARALAGAIGQALPMAGPATAGVMGALGGGGGGKGPSPSTGGLGGADTSAIGGGSDTTVGRPTLKRGGAVKRQEGGLIGPREVQGPVDKYAKDRALGARQGKEIVRQLRAAPYPRSESTESARARSRLDEDNLEADQRGGERTRTPAERIEDVKVIERAGPYKRGGGVK